MGEEEGSGLGEFGSWNGEFDRIEREAGKLVNPRGLKMESEERGNRWSEGVPEGGAGVGFGSATATSPEKAITLHGGSLIESNDETALRGRLDR
jgi:hypothetical protein